jgi:catechol 2,3-dioxygenase-like lactoylglutathione lyase family enzyme
MKMIPIFRVTDMQKAINFYTQTLDFKVADPNSTAEDWVVLLENDGAELILTILEGDQKIGIATNVLVRDIDAHFNKFLVRGLDTSNREESPVHQGPVDQSWGNREFYVTDSDGNTLRFIEPISGA